MTYTVSSGTLNPTQPNFHKFQYNIPVQERRNAKEQTFSIQIHMSYLKFYFSSSPVRPFWRSQPANRQIEEWPRWAEDTASIFALPGTVIRQKYPPSRRYERTT